MWKEWRVGEATGLMLMTVHVGQKMDQGVLGWFGHVERMENERMTKRVYESDIRGVRRRGRPRKCWMDGVRRY